MRTLALDYAIQSATWSGEPITLSAARSIVTEMRGGGVTAAEVDRLREWLDGYDGTMRPAARRFLEETIARGPSRPRPTPARERDIDYERLFADGRFELSFAFGYDDGEGGAPGFHHEAIAEFERDITARGFTRVDPFDPMYDRAALLRFGINPDTLDRNLSYYVRLDERGEPIVSRSLSGAAAVTSLRVLLPVDEGADATQRRARGESLRRLFVTSEVFAYSGHGRYGSGPDVDSIHSPLGNFRIGTPYEAGHVRLSPRIDLRDPAMRRPGYQLAFFDGCTTDLYLPQLRRYGLSRGERDFIVTNQLLYADHTADEVAAFLDGMLGQHQISPLIEELSTAGEEDAFVADGFRAP